jgi:hypothetical protein
MRERAMPNAAYGNGVVEMFHMLSKLPERKVRN